ncbi:UDP-N-acetylmuramoyl-tripeptide--D-alanyl-D-alanine ligase [Treponema pectinovorum]|uniref:UDP-N-acetylmuramoyl-tripeptide--D-alanyl-D- alanine ligase n=1 Tax=Treponema pectinovorum TaxID=164 RepID=UPI0011C74BF4|nr:UDP-N-acetylmuramoyl-tripeptide--D-alanyl-D-alanine ligase [Treponema pectinovorum]
MCERLENKNFSSLLNLNEILPCVCGTLLNENADESMFCFTSVCTDSRNVVEKSLFIPLIGEFQDGHSYIEQAIKKGATVIFVCRKSFNEKEDFYKKIAKENPCVFFIMVENTLYALQKAAERYVQKFPDLIRVSITGSSGKTTTKEIAYSILKEKYTVRCNKGNFNSETGLPLSCFEIRPGDEVALLEMGMNREGEIGELCEVFKPQYAGITNVGTAHIGKLGSREKIAEEKKKIFNHLSQNGVAIIPKDDDYADFLSQGVNAKIVYYGKNVKGNGIEFVKDTGIDGTFFKIEDQDVHLAIPGIYNYSNALLAIEIGRALGLSVKQIKDGIEKVKALDGRSKIVKGKYSILEDCYNANPDSMEKALEFAKDVKISGKKIFVLGSMLELGGESFNAHCAVGKKAVQCGADEIFFVGKEMVFAYEEANIACAGKNIHLNYFEKTDDEVMTAIALKIKNSAPDGSFILLKGSHSIALERLVPLLHDAQTEGKHA